MAVSQLRSLRLRGFNSLDLARITGNAGEIFFDQTSTSLRVMDGETLGGKAIAGGLTVGDLPPSNPQNGQQWLNSITGVIYVWYVDILGGQWIQPITQPVGAIEEEFELAAATLSEFGGVIIDDESISIDENGIISAIQTNTFTNPELLGIATISLPSGSVNSITGATGVVTHDVGLLGTTFYHSSVTSNFTANFTNVPLTNNQSTTVNLIIDQTSTARIPSAVQINGNPETIRWLNNETPAGNSNALDIFSFILIRISGSWIVVGSATSEGAE